MDFSKHYEVTAATLLAIRSLTDRRRLSSGKLTLAEVNFDRLERISTSAALVLTAELSKWEDRIRRNLRPHIKNWNERILAQFHEIGFFELFAKSPPWLRLEATSPRSSLRLIRYIKGRCGESAKARELKQGIEGLVGEEIKQWTFLRGGLDEAITNVIHHAYPAGRGFQAQDKMWYLTGSYNSESRQIKIAFYDQGIGIPASLPASGFWENILTLLNVFSPLERYRDSVMIKAAVEMDRSSTGEEDRGKGLQDLLEFVRQRRDGYLSILSSRGLYKFSMEGGREVIKSENFSAAIAGTLIIWSAQLTPERA